MQNRTLGRFGFQTYLLTAAFLATGAPWSASAQEGLKPIALAELENFTVELHAIQPKQRGSDKKKQLFEFADDEKLAAWTREAGITPWKSTRRGISETEHVLGFLVRNKDGSVLADSVRLATAYAGKGNGEDYRYWPMGDDCPIQEICDHDWPFTLAPLVVRVAEGVDRLDTLEGAVCVFPGELTEFTFTQAEIAQRASKTLGNITVAAATSENVERGRGFMFAVLQSKPPTSRQSSKNVTGFGGAFQNSYPPELEVQGLTADGRLVDSNGLSLISLSAAQRATFLANIVKEVRKRGEDLTHLRDSKNVEISTLRVGFYNENKFDEIHLKFARSTGAPQFYRFEIKNIPLNQTGEVEEVNQFVQSLQSKIEEPALGSLPRMWRDATGKFSIEAKLLKIKDGAVLLEKPDGTTIVVPIAKLSQEDQAFVENL